MENKIKIDVVKNNFIIRCGFGQNHLIQHIPGRKWSKAYRCHVVPYSRRAVKEIKELGGLAEISIDALQLIESKLESEVVAMEEFPSDYTFKTAPRECQQRALRFLWNKKEAALFMKMRTGKTKTVIDWASMMSMKQKIDAVVVFCPMAVKGDWEKQFFTHCPYPFLLNNFNNTNKSKNHFADFVSNSHPFKIMIVATEALSAGRAIDYAIHFAKNHKSVLCVVDESHMIKNHNAIRTTNICKVGFYSNYRVILTGTPITKSPIDLYSQFYFLNPDIIGYNDFYSFRNRYCVTGGYENKEIIGYQNVDELMEIVGEHTFRAETREVAELAPKEYRVLNVELPAKIRLLYDKIKKSGLIVNHDDRQLLMKIKLEKVMRMIQLTNGVMTYGETGEWVSEWVNNSKLNELLNFIEGNQCPTIIWVNGKMELSKVAESLNNNGYNCSVVGGGMTSEQLSESVNKFQTGEVDYIVLNTAVGCAGLNLSRGEMMVYMSNSFKYVDREQSEERATDFNNPGKSILIVDIIASNTVDDELVIPAILEKKDMADYVFSKL